MEDKIFRIVVPEEKETILTPTGKKKEVNRKTFPGYVLVELVMTDDSWFVVRNTPGVTGFVGSHGGGSKPIHYYQKKLTLFYNKWVYQML